MGFPRLRFARALWRCIVLAIGRLPEQEVTGTHLPSRANDHIGVGEIVCIEVGSDQLFSNVARLVSGGDDLTNSIDKLSSPTVVKANVEVDTGIIARQLYRVTHRLLDIRREILQTTKMAQAHSIAVELF